MATCVTCGNEYDGSFEVIMNGRAYTFDCFECAAHLLAPRCETCGCRILGHGVQADERMFCSAHCARQHGIDRFTTRVAEHVLLLAR